MKSVAPYGLDQKERTKRTEILKTFGYTWEGMCPFLSFEEFETYKKEHPDSYFYAIYPDNSEAVIEQSQMARMEDAYKRGDIYIGVTYVDDQMSKEIEQLTNT